MTNFLAVVLLIVALGAIVGTLLINPAYTVMLVTGLAWAGIAGMLSVAVL
jgi:hypothetical protein